MPPRKISQGYVSRRAKELAESGQFERWQGIEFELRFIEGVSEARVWLGNSHIRDELDILCRQAKSRRTPPPPPTSKKAHYVGEPRAATANNYHVVVTQRHVALWDWEIYRNGEPLPARVWDGPYKSVRTAEAAGSVALREFLQALRRE
jgi:hypothetical protein